MKKTLLILFIIFSFQAQSQVMFIENVATTTVPGGINVHLETVTGHGAGFMSNSYSITGNVIELDVCYWFDNTLPILYFTHDFFIPVSTIQEYTINLHIMMSQSTEVCDNFANPTNTTFQYNFMSKEKYTENTLVQLFPNPTTGIINFSGLDAQINHVAVYDISGKMIKSQTSFSEKTIDLSAFQDGIYFVKLQTDQGTLNKKIVLKR